MMTLRVLFMANENEIRKLAENLLRLRTASSMADAMEKAQSILTITATNRQQMKEASPNQATIAEERSQHDPKEQRGAMETRTSKMAAKSPEDALGATIQELMARRQDLDL